MKIALLTGSIYAIPTLQYLTSQNKLDTVLAVGETNPHILQIEHALQFVSVNYKRFEEDSPFTGLKKWLSENKPDVVIVYGFSHKIPSELLSIPRLGFYNVHFSLLPAYAGSSPVFWQIQRGEEKGGITMHQMTEKFDAGPILIQQPTTIYQGENHGMYSGRLSLESVHVVAKGIEMLGGNNFSLSEQTGIATTAPRPSANDVKIIWETQSSRDIENMVNASNPDAGGAATIMRNQVVRIMEVTPAQLDTPAFSAGTIVHADTNYGIFVICSDHKYLRINITQSPEGLLSGFKLAAIGIKAGERFESVPDV